MIAIVLHKESTGDAADGETAIVHCTADSSSTSHQMSRRHQVVEAVRGPVSSGSRHCVNVLKEIMPQEVSALM